MAILVQCGTLHREDIKIAQYQGTYSVTQKHHVYSGVVSIQVFLMFALVSLPTAALYPPALAHKSVAARRAAALSKNDWARQGLFQGNTC
jgi:hypothetical protein